MEQGFFTTENGFHLPVESGSMSVQVFKPARYGPFPAVVLFMGMYGVSDSLRSVATLMAERGFIIFVPDFYWRMGTATLYVPEDFDSALDAMHALSDDRCMGDVGSLLREIRCRRDVAGDSLIAMGISLGGRLCIRTAIEYSDDVLCASSYYAIGAEQYLHQLGKLAVPLQLVVAGRDMFAASQKIEQFQTRLSRSYIEHELLCFDVADHNFLDFSQPGYDPVIAATALKQTDAFIRRYAHIAVA